MGKGQVEVEVLERETDPIERLEAHTNSNMKELMRKPMPDGSRCMFIAAFHIASAIRDGVLARYFSNGV